jgi:hypothetical protein
MGTTYYYEYGQLKAWILQGPKYTRTAIQPPRFIDSFQKDFTIQTGRPKRLSQWRLFATINFDFGGSI